MRISCLAATVLAALAALAAPATAQVYVPIPVTGYTQDVIADAVGTASGTTTSAFDQGSGNANNVFFEQGYAGGTGSGGNGLPPDGAIITSANRSYQLGPISGNNSLRLSSSTPFGTLTLATPAREAALSLLLSGSVSGSGTFTVNWSDGQDTTVYVFPGYDWWENGPSGTPPSVAIGGLGRVDRTTGVPSSLDQSVQPPPVFAIYYADFNVTRDAHYQAGALIDSLTFPFPGGGTLNVMGVSGATVVPEPSSLALLAAAAGAGVARRRWRRS
jgi:hypothetical protein